MRERSAMVRPRNATHFDKRIEKRFTKHVSKRGAAYFYPRSSTASRAGEAAYFHKRIEKRFAERLSKRTAKYFNT